VRAKVFRSKFSDMVVEVYESGFIAITDSEERTFVLGRPPNARVDLILKAIRYSELHGDKT
jgi:hypothetical protein